MFRGPPRVDYPNNVGENERSIRQSFNSLGYRYGPVAQLGARFHGMEEVVGSIPTRSTNFLNESLLSLRQLFLIARAAPRNRKIPTGSAQR
jgi:hypothetical protein